MIKQIALIFNRIWTDVKKGWAGVLALYLYIRVALIVFKAACPTVIFLGMPCPGCGLTRAGTLVLQKDFSGAWEMHPFIYAWILLVLYICYKRYIRGTAITGLIPMVIAITISMFVFYVYRMYRFYPNVEPMVQQDSVLFDLLRRIMGF
nr:DUF2752 domain-containing protein [Lachnospiraceae bacterium]